MIRKAPLVFLTFLLAFLSSSSVEERIKAAQDVLTRVEVRAPVRGVVVKFSHHTPGGVIAPGQEILELLPLEEELLVEAYVRPIDIDVIQRGNEAQLRLTALNQQRK